MKAKYKNDAGFTIIEVLVASAILAVGLLATLNMVGMSYTSRRAGKDVTLANNLAKRIIEDMKTRSYTEVLNHGMDAATFANVSGTVYTYSAPTNLTMGPPVYTKRQTVSAQNKIYTITVTVTENSPQYRLVTANVVVSWTTGGHPHSVSYTTFFNK